MTTKEQFMSDIIIAVVKAAGGRLELTNEDLKREQTEIVYVEQHSDGITLSIKDNTIING